MGKLDNRIAVVTGTASGLGRAIALRLAEEGAQLGLLDIKDQTETLRLLRERGGLAESWTLDVSNEEQVNSTLAAVGGRFDRIDVLVNNAGILSGRKPWYEHTKADVERFIAINYVGYFLVTKAAYPLLKQSRAPARIINIASRTFFSAPAGQMAYIASKGAVIGMTRVLARELGEDGITVNALMPGQVATPGTTQFTSDEIFERTMQAQAIKQRVEPEDLANLVAFIASDDARLITGQTIIADGGGFMH
jgi:NAD(P)-dependent dehydrogenase (short-subunit alcohol dehydrogenase family)